MTAQQQHAGIPKNLGVQASVNIIIEIDEAPCDLYGTIICAYQSQGKLQCMTKNGIKQPNYVIAPGLVAGIHFTPVSSLVEQLGATTGSFPERLAVVKVVLVVSETGGIRHSEMV